MTAPDVSAPRVEHDEFAELRREAAAIGAVLIAVDDGFLLSKWGTWGRALASLDDVRQLIARMRGTR